MDYVKHPLIKPNLIESRLYQETILSTAIKKNTLCVLPTGLGKTPIAILLTAHRLEKFPESKILVLAPTRPLVNQHYKSFSKFLNLNEEEFQVITGIIKPEKRFNLYKEKKIIFATPQTIKNDLESGFLSLKNFSLIVFDEAHHAIGDYPYPFIAKKYIEQAENPKILGLTASPGGTKEKIEEICKNLKINATEIREEKDKDVSPWVKQKEIEWVLVDLPESFKEIKKYLEKAYENELEKLKKLGFLKPVKLTTKKDLLTLQANLQKAIKEGYKKAFSAISLVSRAIKIEHALDLLETQGIGPLEEYWKKIRKEKSKPNEKLLKDKNISYAMLLTRKLFEIGSKHPKMSKLCSIINEQLKKKPDSKIIVFANYRNTVKNIVSSLEKVENARPIEFLGQREGFTQKEQIKRLKEFREGKYNVLVGTSVSEEGLDIPEMDLAIFYEATPSEIRTIQRRGRVGRQKFGKIIVLLAKGTRDEGYYWSAYHKEKRMKKTLKNFKLNEKEKEGLKRFLDS